jgi:hypothetical protein
MERKTTLTLLPLAGIFIIMAILLVPLIPPAVAAGCPAPMTEVDASLSPEDDANNNGIICQGVRAAEGFPTVTLYQDDMP